MNKTQHPYFQFKSFFAFILLLASYGLNAHNGTLKGMVLDAETMTGLPGAYVSINSEPAQITFTDELGIFTFVDLPNGEFRVSISYIGYSDTTLTVKVNDHETTAFKLSLLPKEINLPDVHIASEATANLHTISALDIQTRPLNNSQDILRIVPGLVIAQHAGGGKAEQIFLRGFDIDHGTDIRITADGMPVNMVSHAHGQGYADLHFLIPELVRGVDFAKGNYDAASGDFATAGHVNFNTPTALDRSMVKLEAGQFDTYRTVGAFDLLGNTAKARNQNAWLASEYSFSNSYFDNPQNFTRFNIMGKYSGLIGDNQSITASFSTFKSSWDHSGQIPQRAIADGTITRFGSIDPTEGGNTSRSNLNLVFMKNLGNRTFLKNQVYFVKYDFELYSNFTFFLEDPVNGDQIRQKESRQIIGYNGSWSKEASIGGKRLTTEAGLQIRFDEVDGVELSRTKNRRETTANLALGDVQEGNAGLYANSSLEITRRWKINLGLRSDQFFFGYVNALDSIYKHQTQLKGTFSPKLNLFFDATDALRFYANSGIGFHSNDTRVVVAQQGQQILPKAYGLEFGAMFKPVPSLLLNASVWRMDLQQEFVYVGDAAVVEPSGKTQRQGIDFSARWQVTNWLYADLDLNLTKPRAKGEPEGQNYIPLAPTSTSIGGLTAKAKNGLYGSLRYRHIGDRPANEDNSVMATGQFVVDAMLGFKKRDFDINLSVQNLLNTEFNDAQFDTKSRLKGELEPVSELHFTPGTPFFLKGSVSYFF
ncbi:MAG: TonB-dependent receptor [Saprospiraceae bacterium]|nr:TonB-dependent receptor [Saprospiraceae bacterium]